MPCWRRIRLLMLLDQYLENLQETNRLKGRKYKRSVWIRELFRQPGDFDIFVNDLRATDREYHFHYTRMSKERFDHLLTLISPKITKQDTHLRPAKPASEKLYMTLQFLADGRSQIGLSTSYRMGRSTVSEAISETCDAIYEALSPAYMQHPTTAQQWKAVAAQFEDKWNMPHCIGAVDGKHVRIEKPANTGSTDRNYKGYFSLNLFAICDANYNFLLFGVDGGISDTVFLNSSKFQQLNLYF